MRLTAEDVGETVERSYDQASDGSYDGLEATSDESKETLNESSNSWKQRCQSPQSRKRGSEDETDRRSSLRALSRRFPWLGCDEVGMG